jgi:hypothetical protein
MGGGSLKGILVVGIIMLFVLPTKEEFPTAPPENLVAGSVVFTPTSGPVSLDGHYQWWSYVKDANWRHRLSS